MPDGALVVVLGGQGKAQGVFNHRLGFGGLLGGLGFFQGLLERFGGSANDVVMD